jgi:uncharacterized membrane protein YfcA
MTFPVSGVEVSPIVPPLVALAISFFTSMGGVSGAFLLLPFQVSVLGFASPAVSPTNLLFNILAIPSGVYRYIREGRMNWSLAAVIICGTVPGLLIGVILRVRFLPDPGSFKLFVGCVLLYIAGRLVYELIRPGRQRRTDSPAGDGFADAGDQPIVRTVLWTWRRISYQFRGQTYSFGLPGLLVLSLALGVVSGTYGIGGGALLAPLLVAVFHLPVYTIAGATLLATFVTSIIGVAFYTWIAPHVAAADLAVTPDWLLGFLFGVGGMIGIYCGARCQKFVPQRAIKALLVGIVLFVAGRYVIGFFA